MICLIVMNGNILSTSLRVILFFIIIVHLCRSGNLNCTTSEHGCCSQYFWDQDEQQCKPCKEGYFGKHCSERCKYPHYGMHCLQKCHCNGSFCDFQKGCQLLLATIFSDIKSTNRAEFEKDNTLPDSVTSDTEGFITKYSPVTFHFTTNKKKNPLFYLVLGLGLIFITCISAYFILMVYMKRKSNVHFQVAKISGLKSSNYEEPCDLVSLHV